MNDMIYVVTAVDYGESCDGKARVLGAFRNEDDAKAYVRNDMEDFCDQFAGCGVKVDFDKLELLDEDDSPICLWTIDEIEVK